MSEQSPTNSSDEQASDIAKVTVETPLGSAELVALCRNVERMLRINSLMEFEALMPEGEGAYRLKAKNLSNGKDIDTLIKAQNLPDGLLLTYETGIKNTTSFRAVPVDEEGRANLVVVDDYSDTPEEERRARMDEVDQSIISWGRDFNRYFRHWAKWSWLAPWRWYMNGPWLTMKPSARRVSYLISMITLAEFVMFLMVFVIFWLELDNYVGL